MSAPDLYLMEAKYWDPAVQGERTLRVATGQGFTTRPNESPPNTTYLPILKQPAFMRRDSFGEGETGGRSRVGAGNAQVMNDGGELDYLLNCGFDKHQAKILKRAVINQRQENAGFELGSTLNFGVYNNVPAECTVTLTVETDTDAPEGSKVCKIDVNTISGAGATTTQGNGIIAYNDDAAIFTWKAGRKYRCSWRMKVPTGVTVTVHANNGSWSDVSNPAGNGTWQYYCFERAAAAADAVDAHYIGFHEPAGDGDFIVYVDDFRVEIVDPIDAYPENFSTFLIGTQAGTPECNSPLTMDFALRDRLAELDIFLQSDRYAGDNVAPDGLEGDENLKGKPKPYLLGGPVKNFSPPCVNPWKQIYEIGPFQTLDMVYDMGIPLANDLQSWATQTHPFGASQVNKAVEGKDASGNPLFLLVAAGGKIATSPDGKTYTDRTALISGFWSTNDILGAFYGDDGKWMIVGAAGKAAYSTDPTSSWTDLTATIGWGSRAIRCVRQASGVWTIGGQGAVGAAGKIMTATTPSGTWTARTSNFPVDEAVNALAFGFKTWVAVGGTTTDVISSTTDPTSTWTTRTSAHSGDPINDCCWCGDRFLYVGILGNVGISFDGISFGGLDDIGSGTLNAIAFFFETIWVGGASGLLRSSDDGGTSWKTRTSGFSASAVVTLAAGSITMVAGGAGATVSCPAKSTVYSNATELQDDTLAPPAGTFGYYAAGGYFRLGSPPVGSPTCDGTEGANAAARTHGQLFKKAIEKAGFTTADYSSADITALDALNVAVAGIWFGTEDIKAGDALDRIARSCGARWGPDRAGIIRIKRFDVPSGTPVASFHDNDGEELQCLSTQDEGRGLPAFRNRLRWGHNYTPQAGDRLAGGVSDERRAELLQEWREVSAETLSLQTKHPLSPEMIEESLFVEEDDAQDEVDRRHVIRSTRRGRYRRRVPLTDANVLLDLGDVVEVSTTRWLDVLFSFRAGDDLAALGGVFARGSTATYIDEYGVLRTAAAGVARGGHFIKGRQYLLLEDARTFRQPYSRDLSNWLSDGTSTIATGQPDARGASGATLITSTSSGGYRRLAATLVGDGTKAVQVILKKGSSSTSRFGLWDATAGVWRHAVDVTWSASGKPSVATAAGAAGSGTVFEPIELTGGYWLLRITASSVIAGNTNHLYCICDPGATGTVYFDGMYVEDASFCSMPFDTAGAAAARSADVLYFTFTQLPQNLTVFARLIDLGQIVTVNAGIIYLGDAAGTAKRLTLYSASGAYTMYHHNGSGAVTAAAAASPSNGDMVELRGVLRANGAVMLGQSINGAAEVNTADSASNALATAWADTRLYMGSQAGTVPGFAAIESIVLLKGGKSLAECRTDKLVRGRYGMAVPKKVLVLGGEPDVDAGKITLDLWG